MQLHCDFEFWMSGCDYCLDPLHVVPLADCYLDWNVKQEIPRFDTGEALLRDVLADEGLLRRLGSSHRRRHCKDGPRGPRGG